MVEQRESSRRFLGAFGGGGDGLRPGGHDQELVVLDEADVSFRGLFNVCRMLGEVSSSGQASRRPSASGRSA